MALKLFNRDTTIASLQLLYPLYTGGKISSLISQAAFGKDIAQEEMRRTNLQVIRDVKRYYYAAQLTQSLTETASSRDVQITREDHSSLDAELRLEFISSDKAGIRFLLVVLSDITERKQAEVALQESEARWKFAIEGS